MYIYIYLYRNTELRIATCNFGLLSSEERMP